MNKKNYFLLAGLLVVLVYLAPYIFNTGRSKFLVHDNIDSNVVWYKNLAESGEMFGPNRAIIERAFGGIERGCYPSQFNITVLLYCLFSPLTAYCINVILLHLVAFFGMYLFIKKYIFKGEQNFLTVAVSTLFALLPFWPSGGISIAGQPLLLFAFANIFHNEYKWSNWLIIALFPFYSALVFSNLFFILVLSMLFVILTVKRKKINYLFILSLFVFTLISAIVEYRMISMQFIEGFENQRSFSGGSHGTLNLKGLIGVSFLHFLKGQYHFASLQFPVMVLSVIIAVIIAQSQGKKILLFLLLFTYIISLINFSVDWQVLHTYTSQSSILNSVKLRFIALTPLLWFILFSLALKILFEKNKVFRIVAISMVTVSGLIFMFSVNDKDYFGSDTIENSFFQTYFAEHNSNYQTFDSYYQPGLFEKVKGKIPIDKNIACLGLPPEIAQFNGYNTLGGYYPYFSKKTHELMKTIQEKEFKKMGRAPGIGGHCYFLSKDLNDKKDTIQDLAYNFDLMKRLNAGYVFSYIPIRSDSLINEMFFYDDATRRGVYTYSIK